MILYRPVGTSEFDLIKQSNYTRFPPRLPEQPIFYPVLNEEYAREIAEKWNTKTNDGKGYVTRFRVDDEYISQFEIHTVGNHTHKELWIPAEELSAFNQHIIGLIEVIREFGGKTMVYGVIDTKSKSHYTYLKSVFDAIDNKQKEFNFLITDTEIITKSDRLNALNTGTQWRYENGKTVSIPAPEYFFISGEELTDIVNEDDSQWVWGVLSGFDKTVPADEILKYPYPTAIDNEGLFKNPPSLQHPLSTIEIIPFDSSFVIILSKNKEIIDLFKKAYPDSVDLYEYNLH